MWNATKITIPALLVVDGIKRLCRRMDIIFSPLRIRHFKVSNSSAFIVCHTHSSIYSSFTSSAFVHSLLTSPQISDAFLKVYILKYSIWVGAVMWTDLLSSLLPSFLFFLVFCPVLVIDFSALQSVSVKQQACINTFMIKILYSQMQINSCLE